MKPDKKDTKKPTHPLKDFFGSSVVQSVTLAASVITILSTLSIPGVRVDPIGFVIELREILAFQVCGVMVSHFSMVWLAGIVFRFACDRSLFTFLTLSAVVASLFCIGNLTLTSFFLYGQLVSGIQETGLAAPVFVILMLVSCGLFRTICYDFLKRRRIVVFFTFAAYSLYYLTLFLEGVIT